MKAQELFELLDELEHARFPENSDPPDPDRIAALIARYLPHHNPKREPLATEAAVLNVALRVLEEACLYCPGREHLDDPDFELNETMLEPVLALVGFILEHDLMALDDLFDIIPADIMSEPDDSADCEFAECAFGGEG